jgi:nucleoside-diphosphate-sugar epimerase
MVMTLNDIKGVLMRIFVTGASGWIGSAVVPALLAAGHRVTGLARSDASAATIEALGAEVHRGSLDDPDDLRAGAEAADGVVHLAYNHDFSRMDEAAAADLRAIETFGAVLTGTGGPLLMASGVFGLARGRPGTEQDMPDASVHGRLANARAALDLAAQGVRPIVVRFAPTVHGAGDHGFVPRLVTIARERGVSGFVGDGAHQWAAVHRLDAAELVARAVDKAPAGSIVHAVAESVPTRSIAEAIGAGLGLPVESIPAQHAGEHFGWLGAFFGLDCASSNALTREQFDWSPRHPGLLDDLAAGHYFS